MVQVISRSEWGARHEDGFGSAPLPAREVWLHHSVTLMPDLGWIDTDGDGVDDDEERALRQLEDIGEQRFGRGISYTWAIPPSGRVYQGHGVARQGAHTGGRNSIARAIVLIGNYDVHRPTAQQIESAAQLLVDEYRAGHLAAARLNGGHQQAPGASTACPGRHGMAVIGQINARAAALLAGETDTRPTVQEDTNMIVIQPGEEAVVIKGVGHTRLRVACDFDAQAVRIAYNKKDGGYAGWPGSDKDGVIWLVPGKVSEMALPAETNFISVWHKGAGAGAKQARPITVDTCPPS